MTGLGLNIVISRLIKPGTPFSDRLDELSLAVADALGDLEEMVRAAGVAAGVSQEDLEEHVATAVAVVVGNRCRGAVVAAQRASAARRFPSDTE